MAGEAAVDAKTSDDLNAAPGSNEGGLSDFFIRRVGRCYAVSLNGVDQGTYVSHEAAADAADRLAQASGVPYGIYYG